MVDLRIDDRLNIGMPEALLEYNRWVMVVDRSGSVLAFACFKTTRHGLKLGLNVRGVYGEVSGGVERVVAGRVPEVPPDVAEQVLGKAVEPHKDGRHYPREITNVGLKTKLLVGNPMSD